MTIYFTADLHLGHKNIIEYSNRPFHSIQEMDDCLINNWNNTINDSDEIYILGDLTFYMPKKAVDLVHHLDIGIDAWTEPKMLKLAGADNLSEEFQVHTYKPVSYEDVKRKMSTKIFKPVDHHIYRE